MKFKRPYVAPVINVLFSLFLLIGNLGSNSSKSDTTGLRFEVDSGAESAVGTVMLFYYVVIFITSVVGLFNLSVAKLASGLAIPVYSLLVFMLVFIGILYHGPQLPSLTLTLRVVFVIMAGLLGWLVYACIQTIRFKPEQDEPDYFD